MGDTIGKSRSGGLGTLEYLFSFFGFQNGIHEIIHIVVLPITRFPIMVNWLIFTVTTMILILNLQCENCLLSKLMLWI